jgi:hypothetical protein
VWGHTSTSQRSPGPCPHRGTCLAWVARGCQHTGVTQTLEGLRGALDLVQHMARAAQRGVLRVPAPEAPASSRAIRPLLPPHTHSSSASLVALGTWRPHLLLQSPHD